MPLRLNGATSGAVTVSAPAVAGSASLILPTDSVQPGMVLVATSSFTTAATVSVDNCFTSTYTNYLIVLRHVGSGANVSLAMRLRVGGADASGANYTIQNIDGNHTTVSGYRNSSVTAFTELFLADSTQIDTAEVLVSGPALAEKTAVFTSGVTGNTGAFVRLSGGTHSLATAYDGFTIYPASGTITGSLRVYGLRNSITT